MSQELQLCAQTPFQVLRRTWQPVAVATDLPAGKLINYVLLGQEILLARLPNGLLAADIACPHKGMRLSLGTVEGTDLQCPYHGWRFDQQGRCTNIPSLLDPSERKLESACLTTYNVQERYGFIWVQLEPDANEKLPDVPEFEDAQWTYQVGPATPFQSGFRREIENYLDMTHFAFAHGSTLGKAADTFVPPMEIEVLEGSDQVQPGFVMTAPFPALQAPDVAPAKLQSAHQRWQRCYLPNFTVIRQSWPDGDERLLLHVPSPNTENSCTVFWSLAISPHFQGPEPKAQLEFAIRVLDEDRLMCENQLPAEVPINPSRGGWGVLVAPGDTLANTFQKCLRKYLVERIPPA